MRNPSAEVEKMIVIANRDPGNDIQAWAEGCFKKRYPNAKVKPDLSFKRFVFQAKLFPNHPSLEVVVVETNNKNRDGLLQNVEKVDANMVVALTEHLGESGEGLDLDMSNPPTKEGEERERNAFLGKGEFEGRLCNITLENELEMTNGVVEHEIHLHCRPSDSQEWDDEDNLSVVVSR